MSHEYKVIEAKDDFRESVIEKNNITSKFSIYEIENEINALDKYLKEFKGNLDLQNAKAANIEEHHPFVKEFTPEQLFTLNMYFEARAAIEAYKAKSNEFEAQKKEREAELEEIYKQLGFINTTELPIIQSEEIAD